MTILSKIPTISAAAALVVALGTAAAAEDFYNGKTISLIVGSSAGGGYDTNGRLVARHLGRFIPGEPNIVVMNMPGASGVRAVNHLYAVAPKDGTVIGTFNSAMPFLETIGSPGVRFKSVELSWIGNLSQSVQTVVVWHTTGVKTLEDAKNQEVIMGALGEAGTMVVFPRLLNSVFGTRFRIVTGYQGGSAVNLAMERGEVEGRGAGAWYTWKNNNAAWVSEGKIVPLVQIGPKKDPDLPHVPLLRELAEDEAQRRMFQLLAGNVQLERPFAGPPGIPAERLETLRRAFDRMVQDAAFIAEANRLQTDLDPNPGEEVERIVAEIVSTEQPVIDRLKAAIGLE